MFVQEHFMEEFDAPVKYGVICLCAYWVFLTALPEGTSRRKRAVGGVLALLPALVMALFRNIVLPFHVIMMVGLFMLLMLSFFKMRAGEGMTLITVSFGFSYAAFFLSTMLVCFFGVEYCEIVMGDYHKSDIFFQSAVVHVTVVLVMQVIQIAVIGLTLRSRRLRNGLNQIVKIGAGDVGIYMSVMIMLSVTLFGLLHQKGVNDFTNWVVWFVMLSCILSMGFWIKREIRWTYLRGSMQDGYGLLEKTVAEKDSMIAELRADNDRLANVIHKDNKLLPALAAGVRAYVGQRDDASAQEAAELLAMAAQLESIYRDRSEALSGYESHGSDLPATGVAEVDAVLQYMARQAVADGIEFTAEVSANVGDMLSGVAERYAFNTVLAELTENALKAAGEAETKAVAVNIGSDGKGGFLRVSDSGAAFDEAVLKHMGRRKITTRRDKGGSGTGLMNLFSVLRQYGAAFNIEPCPSDSKYTKSLVVTFPPFH